MTLKAEILPNNRKYYGTRIQLTNTDTDSTTEFNVWVNGISVDGVPSEREYDFKDENGKFMLRDEDVAYEYEICDDHYETEAAYKICQKIVEALDGMEV